MKYRSEASYGKLVQVNDAHTAAAIELQLFRLRYIGSLSGAIRSCLSQDRRKNRRFHAQPFGASEGWCILPFLRRKLFYTMWSDDLYMSTPFLKRYVEITGKYEVWVR